MVFLRNLAYQPILNFPLIGYLGIISYLLMLSAAVVMMLTRRKIRRFKPQLHFRLAYSAVIVSTVHGILALAVYL